MTKKNTPHVSLNLNVRGLPLSATLRINEQSNKLLREGKIVHKLGLGQAPFPVPRPVEDELKANAFQKDYLPVLGLRSLRGSIANYINRKEGVNYNPRDIMVSPGSKELMFILQLVYYGDLVIPTPSWVSYAPQANIIGRHIKWLSTDMKQKWKVTPEEIEKLCFNDPSRPRLVILNYPSNPHGGTYTENELQDLAKAAAKYKIVLLSDEIYGELHHRGRHISISRFYPEGTIISTGLSKWCGAGGWRLGTFIFPKSLSWLKDSMAAVASETYTSTSAPIQYAAVRAFEGGMEIEDYLLHSRRILAALGDHITKKLKASKVKVVKPEGAFYLFPDFETYRKKLKQNGMSNAAEVCNALLNDTGVAILPGTDFGRPANELSVRISYVDFDGAKAIAGSRQSKVSEKVTTDFLEYYCKSTVDGIDKLCNWLHSL